MHCADEINRSNITNLLAGLRRVYFSSLMVHALHFLYKLRSYSLIFPAAQLCPSELINEICHHAKPLCLSTFPKTPQLPDARLPPDIHTKVNVHTHALTHSCVWWFPHGQAGKQPDKHSHVYNVPYKEIFFLQAQTKSLFVFMCRLLCQRMF